MDSAADLGGIFMILDVTALCFCTNYKYETNRTLGDRLDGDQFRGDNRPSQVCLLLFML